MPGKEKVRLISVVLGMCHKVWRQSGGTCRSHVELQLLTRVQEVKIRLRVVDRQFEYGDSHVPCVVFSICLKGISTPSLLLTFDIIFIWFDKSASSGSVGYIETAYF